MLMMTMMMTISLCTDGFASMRRTSTARKH